MKFYDISRDTITSKVYKGDPDTQYSFIKSTDNGDMYNLSQFSMCSHAGTHIDAPFHFDEDGKKIGEMRMSQFYGKCTVVTIEGILTGEDIERLLPHCNKRIIFHSNSTAYLSFSAAQVLSDSDVVLVGTDAISIAPDFDEAKTHQTLARANIAVLENLVLNGVKDGIYTLCAFPLKLSSLEAAPCRAVLIEEGKGF
ncbi:MAG: cyclase family protein [Oscillospiraceae bacterium]|nr:cyclase family protein [Candidatus Ruminococcus equi]